MQVTSVDKITDRILSYNPNADVSLVRKAYEFAYNAHKDQKRASGEPYIIHPVETALILADLEMDVASIAASLLHDVVEDQGVSLDTIKTEFSEEIAMLVDGMTKLQFTGFELGLDDDDENAIQPKKKKAEAKKNAENLRKIFMAMARDLRVMVIKLADRLHNMKTLDALSPERQTRIARETRQLYAPLAHRLGIWNIKWQLEDLAFKYLEPEAYADVEAKVDKTRVEREEDLAEATEILQRYLKKEGIEATITARPKHLWSIYMKMFREGVDFADIYDLSALRVIVNRVGDCYHVLGLVHDLWMPITERFSDYIAKPKSNMYQSLHTKVIGPRGEPLEVQIRTWDMHRTADFGVAAHWQYKERMRSGDEFERKLSWLRQQLFDWQSDSPDAGEYFASVSNDLFTDQVFIFTPRGDVIDLPAGSTPVDFAYRIHSDVGAHCVGAKVNGKIVPLTYQFKNGDIGEIITRSNSQPSLDWLNFVKTAHAKNRIKAFHRRQQFDQNLSRGRDLVERELERLGHDAAGLLKAHDMQSVSKELGYQSEDDMYESVGYGTLTVTAIVNKLKLEDSSKRTEPALPEVAPASAAKSHVAVTLDGLKNLMISRAKCCMPLPGEPVIGYVSRGKGVVLHTVDCPNVQAFRVNEPERLMTIDWNEAGASRYPVELHIKALDRVGLLNDITAVVSESKINITGAKIKAFSDKTADMRLTVEVESLDNLHLLITKITNFPDVFSIERVSSLKKSAG